MKDMICTGIGVVCASITAAFGGWDAALMALLIFMAVDYATGCMVALVFHNSPKTDSGCFHSAYGLKGLCKKGMMLLFVLVAVQLDRMTESNFFRDATCLGFCTNELLSIVENLGLAGVPLPTPIIKALEQLQLHK